MSAPNTEFPYFRYRTKKTATWGSSGNSVTVSDGNVVSNSLIVFSPTTEPVGRWYVSDVSDGSFTITSSDVESDSAGFDYEVF